MRRASELSFDSAVRVLRYLYNYSQYDNRIFSLQKAAFCRQTGRIFPNAINWFGKIEVDWTFLQKRHSGVYVSWGSLTEEQQEIIRGAHDSLEGFQTENSSPHPSPNKIEAKYAFASPGPLYVDLQTSILIGWKCVPYTDLEVLIVQKPTKMIFTTVDLLGH